jgi:uncharacterized protein (TIGR02118 family)
VVHRLLVSYGQPEDAGAFDEYYRDTHMPLAMEMPGLIRFSVGHPQAVDPATPGPYFVAELDFESEAAMKAAFSSPEGRSATKDVANFATGGARMAHYEVHEVKAGMPYVP